MQPGTEGRSARAWIPWALLALVPWAALAASLWFTCDDAYISFRYARNLIEGHGLVYNPGESPPVEGYSNLLWTLASALALAFRLDPAVAANALSLASGAALLLLVARFAARRFGLAPWQAAAAALFTGLLPPMACWATSGLETMAFALCTFLVYERIALDPERPRGLAAGVCAVLAALLRADGAAWALAALVVAAVDVGLRPVQRAAILRAALLVGVAVCAQLAWRHGYYDAWVPNTARVKAGLSALRLERGALYVAAMLVAMPALALPQLLAPFVARGSARRAALAALAMLVLCLGYSVWTGGDFLPFGRFLVPAAPFAGLALALLLASPARWGRPAAAILVALAPLAVFGIQATPQALHFRWNEAAALPERAAWSNAKARAEEWGIVGRALARRSHGESIVLGGIGAVGYFSRLRVFDLFGLVSPEVVRAGNAPQRASPGHDRRVDPEFFFDQHPAYLGAWMSPAGAPLASLPPRWLDFVQAGQARVERFPPGPDEGFPPGTELRVLRFVYSP